MKTPIDRAGRLVIPKEICQGAGLRPGMLRNLRWRAGRIEIEPAPLPVKLVRRGRLLGALPAHGVGALTAGMVKQTRHRLRRERDSGK